MSWALEDHTADALLRIEAPSWSALLREAAVGFGEYVGGGSPAAGERVERAIEVEGEEATETWVRFWRALHRAWSVEGLLAVDARLEEGATVRRVRARLLCVDARTLDASRCVDVKAITWHRAEAAERDNTWRGRIVLDL